MGGNSVSILLTAALLAFAAGSPVSAGSPAGTAETSLQKSGAKEALWKWFRVLKRGLTQSSNQGIYRNARVTAVAAVRGAEQPNFDADRPSWKGGRKARRAARVKIERAEFEVAVELVLAGEMDEGLAALKKFETTHPESLLLPDVREALAKAGTLRDIDREAAAKAESHDQLAP